MMMATHDMRLTAEFEQIVVLEKGSGCWSREARRSS